MTDRTAHYQSYLLHLWRSPDEETGDWCAVLEQADTRQKVGFANLDDLVAFLHQITRQFESEDKLIDGNLS